jgi:NAD-dependent SIR2 family protein deacetylase
MRGAGSFESAECIRCKKAYTKEAIKPQIMRGEVVYCDEKRCKGRPEALVSVEPVVVSPRLEPGCGPRADCALTANFR